MSELPDALADAGKTLDAAYANAVALEQQVPHDKQGAVLLLHLLDFTHPNITARAFGQPEFWVAMLVGLARRNPSFRSALQLASVSLSEDGALDA